MGYTRKLRFAGVLGAGLLATAGMGVAVAQGGVSANLALSNTIFNMKVGTLDGEGFNLFTDSDKLHTGQEAVSRLKIKNARVSDVCMTAPVKVPGMGDKRFQMLVPGDNFTAKNMVIAATDIGGALTLEKPQIGVDASQLDDKAEPGSWGLTAQRIIAKGQTISTSSLSADQLTAGGSKISLVNPDDAAC
ncbi:DUF6230 family protein [Corynebacterium auriscanis]|uniref:DUF6230 family protein n=1 Tax=Corynebacterium auriscanis TaxID=99807 RepID=UPI0022466285|nr:DUF6230 family protein [Corynebacterium auriscanis]MCX2164000.1 DUF6230 family protein [Corynebacterium auriscanis]